MGELFLKLLYKNIVKNSCVINCGNYRKDSHAVRICLFLFVGRVRYEILPPVAVLVFPSKSRNLFLRGSDKMGLITNACGRLPSWLGKAAGQLMGLSFLVLLSFQPRSVVFSGARKQAIFCSFLSLLFFQ